MENSMVVSTATAARRIGVPISLKWLSVYILNPDRLRAVTTELAPASSIQISTKGDRHESTRRFCEGVDAESHAGPAAHFELCQQLWA